MNPSYGRPQRGFSIRAVLGFTVAIGLLSIAGIEAAGLRVLPEGELPNDRRLLPPKDLNGYFPFTVPASIPDWERRAAELRRRIRVATDIWPMPEKTPLNAVIHGRIERDDFTVDRVYFESVPNHFVTGLLFRPKGKPGPLPGVLCPHGHGGRLQDHGAENIKKLLIEGQERFEESGRYPKLSRCVQLARMGCVSFIFDMVGYADSTQLSDDLAHGFRTQRPDFDSPDRWGFFGAQAELRLQSIMGLQTWNSIRALDFLCSLPDVDSKRIGVTGGSGGGTQTILLCAIDDRPITAFPQGMVSTSMQGGCTCENSTLLRVGTGNVELAALFAPRPQAMTAAEDWTRDMMSKGFPELKRLYTMMGAADHVECRSMLHFPHNYNYVTRAMMYSWFNRHLDLGLPEPIVERDWLPLTPDEWTVWTDRHPRPEGGQDYEASLTSYLAKESNRRLAALRPWDAASLAAYRGIVGGAFKTIVGKSLSDIGPVELQSDEPRKVDAYRIQTGLLRVLDSGAELPVVHLVPDKSAANSQTVIWISGKGKAGLFGSDGRPIPAARKLLNAGCEIIGADLLYQGEFLENRGSLDQSPVVSNPREFAGYTFGYNHTVFAHRVHDVLALIKLAHKHGTADSQIQLIGFDGAGAIAALARTLAEGAVSKAAIDTSGFRFVDLKSYRDPAFLPGALKYGDLPAILALSAPENLWLAGEATIPEETVAAYDADGATRPAHYTGPPVSIASAAAAWLLED